MESVFLKVLDMSITAGWLILAVVVLRLILKKTPKWQICILWALVAVRLSCPFSIESALSLIPNPPTIQAERPVITVPTVVYDAGNEDPDEAPIVLDTMEQKETVTVENTLSLTRIASIVWVAGMMVLLGYMTVSYLRLRRRTAVSLRLRDNIYVCDGIEAPFILGIIRTRIYLPSTLDETQKNYVLAHEQAHLKRLDHWWKILGFLLLIVHWFNPLCWLAYILFARDVEFACDEKVIANYGLEDRKAYSMTLLYCGMSRRNQLAWPVAFGEVGVKQRVKGVLNYKKPSFWIVVISFVVAVIVVVCFLTNPVDETSAVTQEITDDNTEGNSENGANQNADQNTNSNVQISSGEGAEALDGEDEEALAQIHAILEQWSKAFVERDGETIVAMASPEVEASLMERELLMGSDGRYDFGISSPWPVEADSDYRIYQYDTTKAEIYYYARTSDPHITYWKETLEYEWIDGECVITDEQLIYYDDISSGAEFEEAYHGFISGSMMDYTYNGLGRVLNEKVLASSLMYSDLCIPEKAAVKLLNLSEDSEKVVVTRREIETEDLVGLDILFTEDNVVATISMMRPYDSMGIWVPVNFTADVVARFMEMDWNEVRKIPYREQVVEVEDVICIGEIPERGIRVYGYNDAEVSFSGVAIEIDGNVNYFDWTYMTPRAILPLMYWDDAQEQLQIAFYTYTGTEASAYDLYVLQYHETGTLTPYNYNLDDYEKALRDTIGWSYDEAAKELVLFEKSSDKEIAGIAIPEGAVNGLSLGNISGFALGDTIMLWVQPGYYLDNSPYVGQYDNMPMLEFEVMMEPEGNEEIAFALKYLGSSLDIGQESGMQSSGEALSLRSGLTQFDGMTYEEYQNKYDTEAEFYHANRYIAPIPGGAAQIVFDAGGYDEELAMSVLDDSDQCLRLEGELGAFVEGLSGKISLDEFCTKFQRENGATTSYVVLKGEFTAYYVSGTYASISFDSDGDAMKDAVLEVALEDGEEIGPESATWLYWEEMTVID